MLYFTENHLWIRKTSTDFFILGLSEYAVKQLQKIMFLDFTAAPGVFLKMNQPFALIETIKIVWEIHAPFTLSVNAVNNELTEEKIDILNHDPEDESAWLLRFSCEKLPDNLMTPEQFRIHTGNL